MIKILTLLISLASASPLAHAQTPAPTRIEMKSISYGPKVVEITEGQSVVWENVSLTDHSATSDDEGKTFDTGMINPKKSSKPVVFAKAGEFRYHCSLHGRTMSGLIKVKAK